MTYTTFSTENADYVLQLGNHLLENKQVDIFEGIDALIIETGGYSLFRAFFIEHPQYYLPLKYCAETKTPVFRTDVRGTFIGHQREIISNRITILPVLVPYVYYCFSKRKVNYSILKLCADWELLTQQPGTEGRNAVNARKIEEFVAPFLTERLGRRPYLGIIFGAGHMGLKPDLQSKQRRDFTIWNWRNLNFGKWAGFVKEDLNVVQEANDNGEEWTIQTYTPNLFDL